MSVLSFLCLSCRSFSLFRRCLLLSLSHYISSILSVFVCFLCKSFSFLRQSFLFFVLSVVLSLPYVTSLYLSLDVVFPLFFVNSHRLCLFFTVVLSLFYVSSFLSLLSQSSFLLLTSHLYICLSMSCSHCNSSILTDFVCLFCRSFVLPTPVLSLLCLSLSLFPLLRSLLCICLSLKFPHCISSILSVLACFLYSISFLHQYFRFFLLSVVPSLSNVTSLHLSLDVVFPLHFVNSLRLCLPFLSFFCTSYVSSFLTLSFFVVVSPSYVTAVYLSVAEVSPLYFVNSLRPCFLSSRLRSLFAFSVVLFLSYVSPFPSLSFSVVPSLCYVAVFCCRFPTIFRQFSPSLFALSVILSLSYVSPFHSWFCQSFFLFLTSLLYICLSMSYSHCILSIISDSVCFFCRSFSFLHQFFSFFAVSVVLSLAYVTSLYLSLDVVFSLHFVNSHRLCLLFLSFFVFPRSVLSLLCLFLSLFPLPRSLLCICLSLKFPHCISSILSDLASYLPDFVVCLLSLSFFFFLM